MLLLTRNAIGVLNGPPDAPQVFSDHNLSFVSKTTKMILSMMNGKLIEAKDVKKGSFGKWSCYWLNLVLFVWKNPSKSFLKPALRMGKHFEVFFRFGTKAHFQRAVRCSRFHAFFRTSLNICHKIHEAVNASLLHSSMIKSFLLLNVSVCNWIRILNMFAWKTHYSRVNDF